MKFKFLLCILICGFVISVNCQNKEQFLQGQNFTKCSENPDELYNRQKVLEQIAEILKDSVPEFKEFNAYNFSAESEKPKDFNVYDLTDVSNKFFYPNDCVNIINNHIYHVYPARYENSLSHIIILENGNLKVFKSINCTNRGDTVEDVITYLNQKIPDSDENKKQILERVKNYRKYGKYPRIDYSASIYCKIFR